MACWIALCPSEPAQLEPLAWWALQFTPRVAVVDAQVCFEVYSSRRLFGGEAALLELIRLGAQAWAVPAGCVAPTAAAARAWVRAALFAPAEPFQWHNALNQPLNECLDALPLQALPEVACHADTLGPLGCRTLGDVRRLPRPGLSRRLGSAVLLALDQAWGLKPEAMAWVSLPDTFDASRELPARLEMAPELQAGAGPLLDQLMAWLAARQKGVCALTLHWQHEFHARSAGDGGACTLRLADPTRDRARLERLLKEHLAQTTLAGPVGALRLTADEVAELPHGHGALFAELASAAGQLLDHHADTSRARQAQQQALAALLEHLAARLGAPQVRQGQVVADHRPECAQEWQSWNAPFERPPGCAAMAWGTPATGLPAPAWLAPAPHALAVHVARDHVHQPLHHGRLQLLAGPHRLESGWWDPTHTAATRDYYLAHSPVAGLVWVFQERSTRDAWLKPDHCPQWFLHGWMA
jgi:protein ImuB